MGSLSKKNDSTHKKDKIRGKNTIKENTSSIINIPRKKKKEKKKIHEDTKPSPASLKSHRREGEEKKELFQMGLSLSPPRKNIFPSRYPSSPPPKSSLRKDATTLP